MEGSTKSLSSSDYQNAIESEILKALSLLPEYSKVSKERGKINPSNSTFQFDFANTDGKIIGEIFACQFPLKAGQARKIKADILKMLTYERLKNTSVIKKCYVVTLSLEQAKSLEPTVKPGVFLKDAEKSSMFGAKSWFRETLNIFEIRMLYYVLSPEQHADLVKTRTRQKEGMAS